MQVTAIEGGRDHLIFGSKKETSFSIESSAAFFSLLSANIYTNPTKAMVREVMCNAWDAHIAAGKTDVPIEVTISPTEFTVKDYGFGMTPDQMEQNYTVYGRSTKADDSSVTGGMGLGCKAPFAVVSTFYVTTNSGGTSTKYVLEKSNSVTGLPTMCLLVSTPSGDSGTTVSIPLQHVHGLRTLIDEVSKGGMRVILNGTELDFIDYSKAKHGFALHSMNYSNYVKYGNVLYPLKDDFTTAYPVILLAPPDSVAVSTSRESLHMCEQTKATLAVLLEACNNKLSEIIQESHKHNLSDEIQRINTCMEYKNISLTYTEMRKLISAKKSSKYTDRAKCKLAYRTGSVAVKRQLKQLLRQQVVTYFTPELGGGVANKRVLCALYKAGVQINKVKEASFLRINLNTEYLGNFWLYYTKAEFIKCNQPNAIQVPKKHLQQAQEIITKYGYTVITQEIPDSAETVKRKQVNKTRYVDKLGNKMTITQIKGVLERKFSRYNLQDNNLGEGILVAKSSTQYDSLIKRGIPDGMACINERIRHNILSDFTHYMGVIAPDKARNIIKACATYPLVETVLAKYGIKFKHSKLTNSINYVKHLHSTEDLRKDGNLLFESALKTVAKLDLEIIDHLGYCILSDKLKTKISTIILGELK